MYDVDKAIWNMIFEIAHFVSITESTLSAMEFWRVQFTSSRTDCPKPHRKCDLNMTARGTANRIFKAYRTIRQFMLLKDLLYSFKMLNGETNTFYSTCRN